MTRYSLLTHIQLRAAHHISQRHYNTADELASLHYFVECDGSPWPCCSKDDDKDGNCHIHSRPGVERLARRDVNII